MQLQGLSSLGDVTKFVWLRVGLGIGATTQHSYSYIKAQADDLAIMRRAARRRFLCEQPLHVHISTPSLAE